MSTQRLYQLAGRLERLEDDFSQRIVDMEKAAKRADAAAWSPDLVRKRLVWLLRKHRSDRQAVEAELRARLEGGAAHGTPWWRGSRLLAWT